MIVIALIIGVIVGFYRTARDGGLNGVVWSIIGIGSYYGFTFILGIFLGLFAPELVNDNMTLTLMALASGAIGVALAYLLLKRIIANKKNQSNQMTEDVLDA